jgi:DNA-directed RNA polymerase subunit H (RpoH/RPB5)
LVSSPLKLLVKHEVLSASDVKKITAKFKVTLDKLPKILESDPQALKIGAKAGQVIAIYRKDPTGGDYLYYRYVVK